MVDLRRKRCSLAGIAVLALLLLVVLPGFLATRPAFFGRVPSLNKKYEPWSTSTHVEAGCEACHVPPNTVARASTGRGWSASSTCRSSSARGSRGSSAHRPTRRVWPATTTCAPSRPKGDLQIPHRAHVTVLKMECVECHDYLVHDKSPEGKHTPPMSGCLPLPRRRHRQERLHGVPHCQGGACHAQGGGLGHRPREEGGRS